MDALIFCLVAFAGAGINVGYVRLIENYFGDASQSGRSLVILIFAELLLVAFLTTVIYLATDIPFWNGM